jgi:hypothetical protein
MAHYEVLCSCDLSRPQRTALTTSLTSQHHDLFSKPSPFINFTFQVAFLAQAERKFSALYLSALMLEFRGKPLDVYIGYDRPQAHTNTITVHMRPCEPEHKDKLKTLVQGVTEIWDKLGRPKTYISPKLLRNKKKTQLVNDAIYSLADKVAPGQLDNPRVLHSCCIMEDIAAGTKQGLPIPSAGLNDRWVLEN